MKDIFGRNEDSNGGLHGNNHSVVSFEEAKLPRGEVLCGNYVGVKSQVFVVCIFVASVSLVAYCFDGYMRVINFVY